MFRAAMGHFLVHFLGYSLEEDTWMTARNKWLLAHPDSSEAKSGAHIGLTGKNIDSTEN